jgi:hypothetical protein
MRLITAGEALMTVAVFVVVGMRVPPMLTGSALLLWFLALTHTAVVWGFVFWNRRGVWQPAALETAAYLMLLRTRVRRRRLAARFMSALLAVEAVGVLVAVAVMADGDLVEWSRAHGEWMLMVALLFGAALVGTAWMGAWGKRELAWLDQLEAGSVDAVRTGTARRHH